MLLKIEHMGSLIIHFMIYLLYVPLHLILLIKCVPEAVSQKYFISTCQQNETNLLLWQQLQQVYTRVYSCFVTSLYNMRECVKYHNSSGPPAFSFVHSAKAHSYFPLHHAILQTTYCIEFNAMSLRQRS